MGTNESKMAVASTPKPDPIQRPKPHRLAQLADPRSPTCGIDRTPIQVTASQFISKKNIPGTQCSPELRSSGFCFPLLLYECFCAVVLQMSGAASAGQDVQASVGPVYADPRSPSVGIVRTPLKDSMKGKLTW